MSAYYNEFDPYAAAWLRNLIAAGHIANGEVDERSIVDVAAGDLKAFTQCHFFAGIGVWSYALRRAGWPDDRPVWTGSCPCQPFSAAGKQAGTADERHLWPAWFNLIRECRPHVVFGEQVEAAIRHGWLDLVQTNMEGIGYAFGAAGFPAAGVGAPHIRARLWFVAERTADSQRGGRQQQPGDQPASIFDQVDEGRILQSGDDSTSSDKLVNAGLEGQPRHVNHGDEPGRVGTDAAGSVAEAGAACELGDAVDQSCERNAGSIFGAQTEISREGKFDGHSHVGFEYAGAGMGAGQPCPTNGLWRNADWLGCRDGKWRPVEPGTFPLAHGTASRVGRLRAYGNAICVEAAEAFIGAYMECRP